jgi:hypothetical protein
MDVIVGEINSYDLNNTMSKRLSRLPVTRNNHFFMDQYQQEYNSVEKERRNKSVTEEPILLVLHHNVQSIKVMLEILE